MIQASGIGTYIKGALPHLISRNPAWRFVLFGQSEVLGQFAFAKAENVTIAEFTAPIYSIREQVGWLTRHAMVDLLWVPHMNIPLLWRRKLLVTVHDVIFVAMPSFFGPIKYAYAKVFFWRIRHRADGLLFVSQFTADEFVRFSGRPRACSRVVMNGVDESWFDPQTEAIRLPALDAVPYLVCVGNLKPHKNLSTLVRAFAKISDRVPHRLVIVGKRDGFLTGDRQVEQLARSMGDRVVFTGYVSDAQLRAIVRRAAALVHPSLYEGFGLTALEAMAAGTPTILSNAGSLPEISGDAASYFDPKDIDDIAETVARTLLDSALLAKLADAGSAQARKYRWGDMAADVEQEMQLIVGPSPHRSPVFR